MSNPKLIDIASRAKRASASLVDLSSVQKNGLLKKIAAAIVKRGGEIERANAVDLQINRNKPQSFLDRLKFDKPRISAAADGIIKLVELDDPVGKTVEERTIVGGIKLKKITVPMGVIAMIYEARPNVTVDAAALCIKASSAVVLRGSADAVNTNAAITDIIRDELDSFGVDKDCVVLCSCAREEIGELLSLRNHIDLAIPRGSKNLIDYVRTNADIPVIETGAGNCCAYVDGTADLEQSARVIVNAKTNRVGVCNALESLIIDRSALERSLPILYRLSECGVTIHGDDEVCKAFSKAKRGTEEDLYREYLGMEISASVVDGVVGAVRHINKYGTHHSDVILSTDKAAIEYFYNHVDSAVVYSNASTRFTDGFRFGLGAEIGISTQKLHARGPMGLNEIVTYKYIAEGDGQTVD